MALCFVAVLGISLAGYISVCSRAMTLSNRSFQGNLSQQLAELGLEEALRAFNKNDWSDWANGGYSADWTLDTANRRATATISFPSGKFGQGSTAAVKIRVDNYDAAHLGSTWSSSTTYRIGDLVGYSGIWYRSVQNSNSNHTPGDLAWWVQSPIPWTWSSNITYAQYDVVNYNGAWYRCHTSGTGITPTNTSYWSPISSLSLSWSSSTSYSRGAIVFSGGAWYYSLNSSNTNHAPPNETYWAPVLDSSGAPSYASSNSYSTGIAYYVGDYIFRSSSDTWYRCVASQPYTYSGGDYSDSSKWVSSRPYIAWAYRTGVTYSYDDVVYYGSSSPTWYRCKVATTTSVPTTTSDWENALSGTNTTSTPGAHGWSSSSINYSLWDTVYYSGQWYRCIKAHSSSGSITPASTTYWTNTPLLSTAWDSGKQYSLNDTVRYNGTWYISIHSGTSNVAQNPATTTGYWIGADTTSTSYTWNTTTSYSTGNYRCYGGVWYRCTTSHTNKSPNDTGYWSAVTAPVIYAEATVAIANSPSLKTQLRAPISPAPLFPNAAGATTDLTITTGTGTVDSYDSNVGAYGGSNVTYSAALAAGSTLAINGTTAVKGYLAWPSPPSGISTGTSVKGSTSPSSPNVDNTRISRSPYVPQFDTVPKGDFGMSWSSLPKGSPLSVPSSLNSTVNLGTPGATTPSRYYVNGILQLGSTEYLGTLNIIGPVILYINNNLRLRGGGGLYINNSAAAEIHVADQLTTESGNNGMVNRAPSSTNPNPKNLILILHSASSSSQTYAYASSLGGVIYAPNTTNTSGLVVGTGVTIYGALSAKNITFSSEANLHYDTSLRYATFGGVDQPYAVTEWRELPVTEQATMP